MSNPFDLQAVACKVYGVLTDSVEARDDDRILLTAIWAKELGDHKRGTENFFVDFLNGKLSNPETVTRMRRKIQEKHVKLRGEKWEPRHQMEAAMCQQLTFFDLL